MIARYHPTSKLEEFGVEVYNALVGDFPQTYFVGGTVRDMLLSRKINDIDVATSATPSQVTKLLQGQKILMDGIHQRFGIVRAKSGRLMVEVATFRQDLASPNRYPKVKFVHTAKADSNRRDFTINALYYDLKQRGILDFHNGLADLKKQRIRFISDPTKRIKEDPLRIIRALRFKIQLKFRLDRTTETAINKNFSEIKKLTRSKIETEISKLPTLAQQKTLRGIINRYHLTTKK